MKCSQRAAIFLVTAMLCGCSENILNNVNVASLDTNIYNKVSNSEAAVTTEPKIDEPNINYTTTNNINNKTNYLPVNEYNVISEFSTDFKNPTKSRAHNITKASVAIDEKVVYPGEEFSFNEAVGPTSKKNGFMLGKIFVNGKEGKGYGGGVCQVSGTLYNAVKKAGLEITERYQHSKPVGYLEVGKDAATSYGVKDFKFVNNKPFPIRINSYINNERITVCIEEVA